jgi:hypothetical protein
MTGEIVRVVLERLGRINDFVMGLHELVIDPADVPPPLKPA